MHPQIQIACLFALLLLGCNSPKNQKVKLESVDVWKYSEGYYVGDVLDFKKGLNRVQGDTIYKAGQPVALLSGVAVRPVTGDAILTLQNLAGNEKGRYVGK